jgi:CBS-domain-containing membrane protein
MNIIEKTEASARLTLRAETAADLMTRNPVSIAVDAPVQEAVAFLTEKGFSTAPVIDWAGRAVGVVSCTDILVHDREKVEYAASTLKYSARSELELATVGEKGLLDGFHDIARVSDIMTPAVFSVTPETPAERVVNDMLALKVHHLFVVDNQGILIGVISPIDVLKRLHT